MGAVRRVAMIPAYAIGGAFSLLALYATVDELAGLYTAAGPWALLAVLPGVALAGAVAVDVRR